jgi:hypothetical protein
MSEAASQKSYLIDAAQLARLLRPKTEDLNSKLTKIAHDSQEPAEKFYEYSKLYNKYFDKISEEKRPLIIREKVDQVKKSDTVLTSPLRKINELIPKSYAPKAILLYNKLSNSPDLKWDNENVYLNDQVISKLNIMDLLKLYTSRKKVKDVEGFSTFKTYVNDYLQQEQDDDKSLLNDTISSNFQTEQAGHGWLRYDF